MSLDSDIENMFKKVAASLRLGYEKTTSPTGDVYNFFYKNKPGKVEFLARFVTFIESKRGKIRILVNFGTIT